MDPLTLLVRVLVVLWFVAVAVAIVRAWLARGPRLAPISARAHDRFSIAWNSIESEFVQSPAPATRKADDLVHKLLVARGRPTAPKRLPKSMQEARWWIGREGDDGTEALRQAMVRYRVVFEQFLGPRPREEPGQSGRRTMA